MGQPVPSRAVCLRLISQSEMPENIRAHSLLVADVALGIAELLCAAGLDLDVALVEAAALLHDVGKARGLETGEHHARLGGAMVVELGWPALVPAVQGHTGLEPEQLRAPLDESLLVNYADKRVRHDEVVTLDERFDDLGARYARGPEALAYLERLRGLYSELEAAIFDLLEVTPEDVPELVTTRAPRAP